MKREANILLELHLNELGIRFVPEFRFHKERKWRADYHLPEHGILIEIDGAVFTQGRHTRGAGREADMRKANAAVMLGYRPLTFSTNMVKRAEDLTLLRSWLEKEN